MTNAINKGVLVALLILVGAGVAVSGCAVESIPYPKLSTPKKLTNRLLSRDEQAEAIRDLSAEQAKHESSAINAIEKSP